MLLKQLFVKNVKVAEAFQVIKAVKDILVGKVVKLKAMKAVKA